jgi:hypothetical protein
MEDTMHVVLNEILGLTLEKIDASEDEIIFHVRDKRKFVMNHEQDCCEAVWVEDITGDLDDLIGAPLVRAEERTEYDEDCDANCKWTFYEFATIKGSVTIRWCGSSEGPYSVSVTFGEV